VRMALETAHLLGSALPVDESVMHYLRAFAISNTTAQVIFQRAMARLADFEIRSTTALPVIEAPRQPRLPALTVIGLRATG